MLVGTLVKFLAAAAAVTAVFGGLALAMAAVLGPMVMTRFCSRRSVRTLPGLSSL